MNTNIFGVQEGQHSARSHEYRWTKRCGQSSGYGALEFPIDANRNVRLVVPMLVSYEDDTDRYAGSFNDALPVVAVAEVVCGQGLAAAQACVAVASISFPAGPIRRPTHTRARSTPSARSGR